MATTAVVDEQKFLLPGIVVIRRMLELCSFEAISLQEGGLSGGFSSCDYGNAVFGSAMMEFAVHGRFVPPPGHCLSCYVHETAPESWCAGMPLTADTLLIVLPGNACEVMLAPGTRISMALAPLHGGVKRMIEAHADSFGLSGRQFSLFHPDSHAGTPWRTLYEILSDGLMGGNARGLARLLESGAADFLIDEYGLRALFARAASVPPYSFAYRAHYPAFRKAVQFMRENLQRDIYMEEAAAMAQISDRSLRLAFDDLLGVSPTRYLTLLRLHEASRQLSAQSTQRLSVKSVAMNCGIWNLSRFAANYRRAFDEHPSDTLMRACSFAS